MLDDITHPSLEQKQLQESSIPATPSASSSSLPPSIGRDSAIKEFQSRLVLLNHAAICPFSNRLPVPKPCRGYTSCYEMVQLLKHVNSCELRECPIQHCVSTRFLLAHNKGCVKDECIVCKPLKESIKRKNERNKQVVTINMINKRKREPGLMGAIASSESDIALDDISPLSTPRYQDSDNESEGNLSARRRKVGLNDLIASGSYHGASGESESDTASVMSSTIYQALAAEYGPNVIHQSSSSSSSSSSNILTEDEAMLETMNECLNIQPELLRQQQQQSSSFPSPRQMGYPPNYPPSFLHYQQHPSPRQDTPSPNFLPVPAPQQRPKNPLVPALPLNGIGRFQPPSSSPRLNLPGSASSSPRLDTIFTINLNGTSSLSSPPPPSSQGLSPPPPAAPRPNANIPLLPLHSLQQQQQPLQSIQQQQQQQQQKTSARDNSNFVPKNCTVTYHCYKCSVGITKGYRYYCDLCNISLCMDCFHDDTSVPHEHPIRAIKADSANKNNRS
jgi:hypothetical protein